MTDQAPEEPAERPRGRDRPLTTRQVADRLGVKPETVYAYVSRGLLARSPSPDGRGSVFESREVEALARRSGRRTAPSASSPAGTVSTSVTLIDRDRCYYRGVDSSRLASRYSYEEVAEWLWSGRLTPGTRFRSPVETRLAATRAVAALPDHSSTNDRLRAAAVAAAAADPLRFDTAPDAVRETAPGLIATLVDALPLVGPEPEGGAGVAARLWSRLSPRPADHAALAALNAALVLLVDHDLAVSTLAARVAASARADPYAVVLAGLGALDSPLHGGAGAPAHRMLAEIEGGSSAAAVVADRLRTHGSIPGVGHLLYPREDPRATTLFALLDDTPVAESTVASVRRLLRTAGRHAPAHATVDLALATFTVASAMPPESGQVIFAVARTAGWIAHALEEYAETPMRMRPSGVYRGPRPPQPLP